MNTVTRRALVGLLCVALAAGGLLVLDRWTASSPSTADAPVAAEPSAELVPAAKKKKVWKPKRGTSWQWQLSGRIDTSVQGRIYDVDSSVSAKTVAKLHKKGHKVVCYISAGSWESYRSDAKKFPKSVRGRTLDGWPDERWLDIRRIGVLKPLMAKRMDVCKRKGFDGVEPDNVDGYQNKSGFPLTGKQQRAYNIMLSKLAHSRGLAIGLKNDVDQVKSLQRYFDFAVNEQCVEYDECHRYKPFLEAGKPVLNAEYNLSKAKVCATAKKYGLSSIRKKLSLSAWRRGC